MSNGWCTVPDAIHRFSPTVDLLCDGVILDDISVEDNNESNLDQISEMFPKSCHSRFDIMGARPETALVQVLCRTLKFVSNIQSAIFRSAARLCNCSTSSRGSC